MVTIPYTVEVIDKLRGNCHLGKHKHFEASKRGHHNHIVVGMPIVVINIILGSLLFALAKDTLPDWSKWVGAIFALVAAALGALQTFFNFKGDYQGHRSVANQYLSIARECELHLAQYFDRLLTLNQLSDKLQTLNGRYDKVNSEAEKFFTKEQEYQKALAIQNDKTIKEPTLVQRVQAELRREHKKDNS